MFWVSLSFYYKLTVQAALTSAAFVLPVNSFIEGIYAKPPLQDLNVPSKHVAFTCAIYSSFCCYSLHSVFFFGTRIGHYNLWSVWTLDYAYLILQALTSSNENDRSPFFRNTTLFFIATFIIWSWFKKIKYNAQPLISRAGLSSIFNWRFCFLFWGKTLNGRSGWYRFFFHNRFIAFVDSSYKGLYKPCPAGTAPFDGLLRFV